MFLVVTIELVNGEADLFFEGARPSGWTFPVMGPSGPTFPGANGGVIEGRCCKPGRSKGRQNSFSEPLG